MHRAFLLSLLSAASLAFAAALPSGATLASTASTVAPPVTRVIRGGTLFDAESGTTRPLGQLLIAGERIAGFAALDAALPAGAELIEADGCTVLPGLFDLHSHL